MVVMADSPSVRLYSDLKVHSLKRSFDAEQTS